MTVRQGIAARYVDAMNRGDIEAMMSLFAAGAVMRHQTGVYADADAIRTFFLEIAFGNEARLQPICEIEGEDVAWLEAEAESRVTPGKQRVVDVFRLDQNGDITDLGVYSGNVVPGSDSGSL